MYQFDNKDIIYPLIQYPYWIEKILNDEFEEFKLIDFPAKPEYEKIDKLQVYTFILSIVLLISFLDFRIKCIWGYAILAIIAIFSFPSEILQIKAQNKSRKKLYNNKIEEIIEINNQKLNELRILKGKDEFHSFKRKKILDSLKNHMPLEVSIFKSHKGLTHNYFYLFLNEFFKDYLKINIEYIDFQTFIPYELFELGQPDFIIKTDDICIDVKIDNPDKVFAQSDNESLSDLHHFIENNISGKHGWCTIRFLEEQVLLHPFECCKFIATFIADNTGNTGFLLKLENFNLPQRTRGYSKTELMNHAKNDFEYNLRHKAKLICDEIDFVPDDFFENLNRILVIKTQAWDNDNDLFVNFNSFGPTHDLVISKSIVPDFKVGDSIILNLNEYKQQSDIHYFFDITNVPNYEKSKFKKRILRISKK